MALSFLVLLKAKGWGVDALKRMQHTLSKMKDLLHLEQPSGPCKQSKSFWISPSDVLEKSSAPFPWYTCVWICTGIPPWSVHLDDKVWWYVSKFIRRIIIKTEPKHKLGAKSRLKTSTLENGNNGGSYLGNAWFYSRPQILDPCKTHRSST